MTLLSVLDLCAVAVFAVSGALVASRREMDVVGFLWLGIATGVGGGTVRDAVLDVPVFWVVDSTPIVVCIVASVTVYFLAHKVQSRFHWLLWLDAIGLALFAIAGSAKALGAGAGPVVAVAMGVITGTLGGVIRDLLGQEPSVVLRREIYVTAALAGALGYVALRGLEVGHPTAAIAGFCLAFAVRALALLRGWTLPRYQARPGRDYPEEPRQ